ncbi:acyl-CoA thioesterase [Zeaxanthinibacter enoshimensis]|uniref:Acyl-CoA thioesterase 2 n=1 Tax=Zeaxanthinibacter enoshimensis TaxID=392009 RepID=A0A4R6TNJ7_9FLAO|nr:acyl-CoA thioesterase II [Zeaxanthinibacter enoshimensis]TDQ30911.1 acyl-CoA thioesterase-2 [Zeaxanthinibacter enoshimensis]
MQTIDSLISLLTLERLDEFVFKGENYQAPWGRVFGGQVLAQALHAAYQTVPPDRYAHSLHAYFILGGDLDIPIVYEVDTIRNGGSFTTRRVVAKQKGKAIFNMAASFQVREAGADHQITMPNVLLPSMLASNTEQLEDVRESNPEYYKRLKLTLPEIFEFRSVEKLTTKLMSNSDPYSNLWMCTKEKIDLDLPMQQQILAYVSDYNLLFTASLPHREELRNKRSFFASLDHSIWFHRDFKIDEWLLYSMDSPSASNARGFARGSIFTKEGELVASVAQEGLMRIGTA